LKFLDLAGNILRGFRSSNKGYQFRLASIDASTNFNNYKLDKHKLAAVLSNPAALKVFALQCDLFSLGKVYAYKEDIELESDPLKTLIENPNPMQSGSQFLWDFMFWNMLGNAYLYCDSAITEKKGNRLYFLEPYKIEWPYEMNINRDKLIFSDETLKAYSKKEITYRYDDGSTFKFPLDRLIHASDLTNGLGNFFKGPSRLDALYKVISNSEHALDAKNINVRFTGKFLVGSANTIQTVGLGDEEKKDIIDKMDSTKNVWPLKTMVQIRRFVDDMNALGLDEAFLSDYFLIGSMYGIPRDVLEANVSSTYENQEKSRMAHVSYTLQPKGNDFMNLIEKHFGYKEKGINLVIDWMHLPFTQVFEAEKSSVESQKIASFKSLIDMGVSVDDANAYLDLDFKIEKKPEPIEPIQEDIEEDQNDNEDEQA